MGYRLARGAFWSFVGTLISRGLSLASLVLAARMLGKGDFGQLGMLQSTLGMFGVFAGFGVGLTATKYVAEFRSKDGPRASRIMALSSMVSWVTGALLSLALIVAAPWLAHDLKSPEFTGMLRLGAPLVLLGCVSGAQTGMLSGLEAFKSIAQVNLVSGMLSFPLIVGAVYWDGLRGAVVALVATQAINCICNHIALRSAAHNADLRLTYSGCLREYPVLWSFSLPTFLAGLMVLPASWLCNRMLFRRIGGEAEMGIYNAANQWFIAAMFLPGILGQAVMPVLSQGLGERGHREASRILAMSLRTNAAIVIPIVVIGCLASPWIMRLYGPGFQGEELTLITALMTAGLLALQIPVGQIILASDHPWIGCAMNLGWAISMLVATWGLVSHGAQGLAGARFLAYLVHATWTWWYAYRILHPHSRNRSKVVA